MINELKEIGFVVGFPILIVVGIIGIVVVSNLFNNAVCGGF